MTDDHYENHRVAKEPRRQEDRKTCPVHDLIQSATSEHRASILKQLGLKADTAVVDTHLRSVSKTIGILITVGCLTVAGIMGTAFVWLRSDRERSESMMMDGISAIHHRITENANERIRVDSEQTRTLEQVQGTLGTINWRLSQIEETHKK